MPFTISHIAAFCRSIARCGAWACSRGRHRRDGPDLDLALPLRLTRAQTHGGLALFTFALPVGLAVWALFQMLVKPAVTEVLPNRVFTRLRADHFGRACAVGSAGSARLQQFSLVR